MLWALIGISTISRLIWAGAWGRYLTSLITSSTSSTPPWSYFDQPLMVALVGRDWPGSASRKTFLGLRPAVGLHRLVRRLDVADRTANCVVLRLEPPGLAALVSQLLPPRDGGCHHRPTGRTTALLLLLTLDRLAVALTIPTDLCLGLSVSAAWGGALLSKYHAVLLPPLISYGSPARGPAVCETGAHSAVVIGLIAFAPVIAWNATHDWASFLFQGGRASLRRISSDLMVSAAIVGIEALYLFPWLWIDRMLDYSSFLRYPAWPTRLGQE